MHKMTDGLHTLASHGFQFAHPHDGQGRLIAVVGIRVHHEVIDIVQLYGDHDAEAARIPGEEPDILFPRTVLWRTTGTAQEVIDAAIAHSTADTVSEACELTGYLARSDHTSRHEPRCRQHARSITDGHREPVRLMTRPALLDHPR